MNKTDAPLGGLPADGPDISPPKQMKIVPEASTAPLPSTSAEDDMEFEEIQYRETTETKPEIYKNIVSIEEFNNFSLTCPHGHKHKPVFNWGTNQMNTTKVKCPECDDVQYIKATSETKIANIEGKITPLNQFIFYASNHAAVHQRQCSKCRKIRDFHALPIEDFTSEEWFKCEACGKNQIAFIETSKNDLEVTKPVFKKTRRGGKKNRKPLNIPESTDATLRNTNDVVQSVRDKWRMMELKAINNPASGLTEKLQATIVRPNATNGKSQSDNATYSVPTSNSFAHLSSETVAIKRRRINSREYSTPNINKNIHIPPILIKDPKILKEEKYVKELLHIAKENHVTLRVTNTQAKLSTSSASNRGIVIANLQARIPAERMIAPKPKAEQKRATLLVLRNETYGEDEESIKQELYNSVGVSPVRVKKMGKNNRLHLLIYDGKFPAEDLIRMGRNPEGHFFCAPSVKLEKFKEKPNRILQCKNCFSFDHSKQSCIGKKLEPKKLVQMPEGNTTLLCINCENEGHGANESLCPVFQAQIKKRVEALTAPRIVKTKANKPSPVREGVSFAQSLKSTEFPPLKSATINAHPRETWTEQPQPKLSSARRSIAPQQNQADNPTSSETEISGLKNEINVLKQMVMSLASTVANLKDTVDTLVTLHYD